MPTAAQLNQRLSDDHELWEMLSEYQKICPCPDGIWPCDTGACILAYMCDQRGWERQLRDGYFYHDTIESYNETLGYAEGSDDWATWTDEAHCWVEVQRPYGVVLLDPNAERMPEPKFLQAAVFDPERDMIVVEMMCVDWEWIESPYAPEPIAEKRPCGFAPDEDIQQMASEGNFGSDLTDSLAKLQKSTV